MLCEWINGERRQPRAKGETTTCSLCGAQVHAVVPSADVAAHWRHRAGDCDRWSEPEGPWHLGWKERFAPEFREVPMYGANNERHRADLLCSLPERVATVVELQHSPINETERDERERFYMQDGRRMFWLLHLHDSAKVNLATTFKLSMGCGPKPQEVAGKQFWVTDWCSTSSHFIEKWKRSSAYVFFDCGGTLFFLATKAKVPKLANLAKGEFAVCQASADTFMSAVLGSDAA
jgi:hypothetical protein